MAEKGKGRSLKDRLVDMGVLVEKDESPSAAQGSAAVSGPGAPSGPGPVAGGVDRDLLKQLLAAATNNLPKDSAIIATASALTAGDLLTLLDLKLKPGSSVAILSGNSIEHAQMTMAAMQARFPVAPNTTTTANSSN